MQLLNAIAKWKWIYKLAVYCIHSDPTLLPLLPLILGAILGANFNGYHGDWSRATCRPPGPQLVVIHETC